MYCSFSSKSDRRHPPVQRSRLYSTIVHEWAWLYLQTNVTTTTEYAGTSCAYSYSSFNPPCDISFFLLSVWLLAWKKKQFIIVKVSLWNNYSISQKIAHITQHLFLLVLLGAHHLPFPSLVTTSQPTWEARPSVSTTLVSTLATAWLLPSAMV